jgi:hypothetical protein
MKKEYKVYDLRVVAYLDLHGFKQASPPIIEDNKAVFIFEGTEGVAQAMEDFFLRRGTAEPRALLDAYRDTRQYSFEVLKKCGCSHE